jgi:hypothetical protein
MTLGTGAEEWLKVGCTRAQLATRQFATVSAVATFGCFLDIVGAKGTDGFGAKTIMETLLRATFKFNVAGPRSGLKAGVGVEYWNNKFGCNNSASFVKDSCKATTPMVLVSYQL